MKPTLSPDKSIRVDLHPVEMRMSHTVANPVVTHVPTGDCLLDLTSTLWDADPSFESDGRLTLSLREYPGTDPGFLATIDFSTMEVFTRAARSEPTETTGSITLERLWSMLAPDKRIPESVRRRRRALEAQEAAQDEADAQARRRAEAAAALARQQEVAREIAEAERRAELDRRASAARMKREADDAYQFVLARAGLAAPTPMVPSQPTAAVPSLRHAASRFRQAAWGFALTLGSIAFALALLLTLTWLLAEHTPIATAPSWLAWPIASLVASVIVIGVPFGLLIWGFRNYRG